MAEDQDQHMQISKNHRASNEATEQSIKPKQSYWPIVLAASLTLTLIGVILMSHPIIFWIGVAFVIVSFVGWGIERR
ncbi:MAG TPA: cytochrome c oxidase subunit 4 [Ktedonobacteraceae bacterium]|nr:cytochrome c oxidase subunit 4 [Ktedonobacteraceae bacterium]